MSTEDDYPDDEALLALRQARIEELEAALRDVVFDLTAMADDYRSIVRGRTPTMSDRTETPTMRCWIHGGKGAGDGDICTRRHQSNNYEDLICIFVPVPPSGRTDREASDHE